MEKMTNGLMARIAGLLNPIATKRAAPRASVSRRPGGGRLQWGAGMRRLVESKHLKWITGRAAVCETCEGPFPARMSPGLGLRRYCSKLCRLQRHNKRSHGARKAIRRGMRVAAARARAVQLQVKRIKRWHERTLYLGIDMASGPDASVITEHRGPA